MARPGSISIESEIDRFVYAALDDVMATVGQAVVEYANSRTSKQFLGFLEEVSQPTGQALMAEAHRDLAARMQASTIASWGAAKPKLRKAVYDPLRSSRFHGGMDKAVRDPNLVHSSARGIQFGDVSVLDRDARQWARLNFGAAPTGQGSNERYHVRFSNLPALEFAFTAPARPGYGLPKGNFKGPDGGWEPKTSGSRSGAFYPAGGPQRFPTKGNVGYRYLDAGIRRFFTDIEEVYGEVFRKVLPSGRRRGRPPIIAEVRRVSRAA